MHGQCAVLTVCIAVPGVGLIVVPTRSRSAVPVPALYRELRPALFLCTAVCSRTTGFLGAMGLRMCGTGIAYGDMR
eukprot:3161391-Rhodomonas_salina.1